MKRFSKKVDKIFWLIVSLLPLLVFFFWSIFIPVLFSGLVIDNSNVLEIVSAFSISEFMEFMSNFEWPFVSDIISNIFSGVMDSPICDFLCYYISYCVSVEFLHVFFDFIVFLPRFCHNFLGGFYNEK